VSLDAPTDESLDETLTDLALGFVPVVGTAQAGRDFERSRRDNDKLGMVLSAAAGIPVVGGVAKAINTGRKTEAVVQALKAAKQKTTAVEVPEVLHGSPMRGLANLSPSKSMEVRGATWFSDNPDVADQYTFPREYGEILYDAKPGEVYKAGLSFKNPMTVDMEGKVGDAMELSRLVKKAKEEGYDGLIIRNVDDSIDSSKLLGTSYAVFDPSQIKLKKKSGRKTEAVVNALRDTSKNKKLVDVFNRQARYEIDSANKRILNVQSNPDTPLLEHKQITDLSDLDQIKDPIFNYPKAQVLKEIGEQNGFNVKVQGSNVSDSVYAKFYKEDDNGMFDFKVRISDHADVSRNTPAGEIKAYDINPDSSGSMEEITKLLNDPNWLNKFYTSD